MQKRLRNTKFYDPNDKNRSLEDKENKKKIFKIY